MLAISPPALLRRRPDAYAKTPAITTLLSRAARHDVFALLMTLRGAADISFAVDARQP